MHSPHEHAIISISTAYGTFKTNIFPYGQAAHAA